MTYLNNFFRTFLLLAFGFMVMQSVQATCPLPTNVRCGYNAAGQLTLRWDAVPGATYEFQYVETGNGSPFSSCCQMPNNPEIVTHNYNNNVIRYLPQVFGWPCIMWRVRVICADGTVSPYTSWLCFDARLGCNAVDPNEINLGGGFRSGVTTESSVSSIDLYPNPTRDRLHIKGEDITTGQIVEFHDYMGRKVSSQLVNQDFESTVNVSDLKEGVFMVTVRSIEGKIIHSSRIIVRH